MPLLETLQKFDLKKILKTALAHGGDFADLYAEEMETTQIISEDHKIDTAYTGRDRGVGLRVLHNFKTAHGFTNDISEKSLLRLAHSVAHAVKEKKILQDIHIHPVPPPLQHRIQQPPKDKDLQTKLKYIHQAEAVGWKLSPLIKQVKVLYADIHKDVVMINSLGEVTHDTRVYTLFYTQIVTAEDGRLQTGYHPVGGLVGLELLEQEPPEMIARKAALQALLMLKARKAPGGAMPVVISSEAGGTMIHEAVGHGLEADLACEGLSVYHNKLGQEIASPLVSVLDDATIPNKRGSFVFDDEGVAAQKTVLIEKGVLKNYMFDRRYSLREKTSSTGNGRRESFRKPPIVRMTNTMIAPGKTPPEDIIRSTEKGLFVKKMGGGQVNSVNGDFVFEVQEGYLIDKGKMGDPVRGDVLTGNGLHVLKIIDKVGKDLGFAIGTCGKDGQGVPVGDAQPTIRIPELTVGGEV